MAIPILSRRQTVALKPVKAIESLGHDRFRSTGAGATLDLCPPEHGFPVGPARIEFRLSEAVRPMEAIVRAERDGEPLTEIVLPPVTGGRVRAFVMLPSGASALRLAFKSQPGAFRLAGLSITGLSRLGYVLARVRDPATLARAARLVLRRGPAAVFKKAFTVHRHQGTDPYLEWVRRYDALDPGDIDAIRCHIAAMAAPPLISVLMPVFDPPEEYLTQAIGTVQAQLYPHWQLCIADDASTQPAIRRVLERAAASDPRIRLVSRPENGGICAASNSALELASGSHVALFDHDDALPRHALYMVAAELALHPDADLIYSDEDKINADGVRYGPHFKPDWNYDLLTANNMVSHLGVYRAAFVRELGGFREGFEGSQDYDLALRVGERAGPRRIRHIPFILYHWRVFGDSSAFSTVNTDAAAAAGRCALADHFRRLGISAKVVEGPAPTTHRVIYPLPEAPPLVSLLVPTRDRAELLEACVAGLLDRTDYPALEILILDNESREPATFALFERLRLDPRVRIERFAGDFNFAAINNFGAGMARGDILGLINNDIEVITPGWLAEMVGHALRPNVGAVGAKLLYPDDTAQHAGIVLGIGGVAGHAFKYLPGDDPGYCRRATLTQNYSAVTAACMVLSKERYLAVGGMDAAALKVAFNDVDLCLKLGAAGYDIVWTPYAVLRHCESASRGADGPATENARFRGEVETMTRRWGARLAADPCYNPNLTLDAEDFRLADPPRVARPWRDYIAAQRS